MTRAMNWATARVAFLCFAIASFGCEGSEPNDGVDDRRDSAPDLVSNAFDDVEPTYFSSAHILLHHDGVTNSLAPARTHESALALADSLVRAIAGGADFAAAARRFSDDETTRLRGGSLGPFRADAMRADYFDVVSGLAVGGVSDPTDTSDGVLIVTRRAVEEVRFQHILVGYEGTEMSRSYRTREKALAIAEFAHRRVIGGEDFDVVANELTDRDPDDLTIHSARGGLEPDIESIVFDLAPGEVSPVRETSWGFHVFRRLK